MALSHSFTHSFTHTRSLTQSLSAHSLCTDRVSCLWASVLMGQQEGWDGPARGWAGNKAEKKRGSVCMVECMPWPVHPLRDACYSLQISTKPLCSSPVRALRWQPPANRSQRSNYTCQLHASLRLIRNPCSIFDPTCLS
jgi:hypothetical protein